MLDNSWKFPNRNVQTFGFFYHDTNGQNHIPVWKIQSLILSEICTVIVWQDYHGKGNSRKSYWNTVGKKVPTWEWLFVNLERTILICVCGRHKIGWKETTSGYYVEDTPQRRWFGEPTSFLDHVYLGCTQRQCEISKDTVDNYRNMFESRISASALEKLPSTRKLDANIPHGPMTWKVMQRNAWKDIANWRTNQLSSCTKSQHHALTTTHSRKKKKQDLLENCQKCAHNLFMSLLASLSLCTSTLYAQMSKNMVTDCSVMLVFGSYW